MSSLAKNVQIKPFRALLNMSGIKFLPPTIIFLIIPNIELILRIEKKNLLESIPCDFN